MISQTLSDAPSGVSTSSPSTLLAKPDIFPTSVESVRQGGEDIFRHHQITVHNADCMEVMARFPDKYFELAIVDPPYGLRMATVSSPSSRNRNSQLKFYNDLKSKRWDNSIPDQKYFEELKRISHHQIIWGGNYMCDYIGNTKCVIIWDKMTYIPTMSQYELAFCSMNKHPAMVAINSTDANRQHPTQKPVALYRWLLANYAKPGWKILDTHGGSLSSAIACHYAGNPLVACELDPDYFKAACARLVRETAQAELPIITKPQHEQAELI